MKIVRIAKLAAKITNLDRIPEAEFIIVIFERLLAFGLKLFCSNLKPPKHNQKSAMSPNISTILGFKQGFVSSSYSCMILQP